MTLMNIESPFKKGSDNFKAISTALTEKFNNIKKASSSKATYGLTLWEHNSSDKKIYFLGVLVKLQHGVDDASTGTYTFAQANSHLDAKMCMEELAYYHGLAAYDEMEIPRTPAQTREEKQAEKMITIEEGFESVPGLMVDVRRRLVMIKANVGGPDKTLKLIILPDKKEKSSNWGLFNLYLGVDAFEAGLPLPTQMYSLAQSTKYPAIRRLADLLEAFSEFPIEDRIIPSHSQPPVVEDAIWIPKGFDQQNVELGLAKMRLSALKKEYRSDTHPGMALIILMENDRTALDIIQLPTRYRLHYGVYNAQDAVMLDSPMPVLIAESCDYKAIELLGNLLKRSHDLALHDQVQDHIDREMEAAQRRSQEEAAEKEDEAKEKNAEAELGFCVIPLYMNDQGKSRQERPSSSTIGFEVAIRKQNGELKHVLETRSAEAAKEIASTLATDYGMENLGGVWEEKKIYDTGFTLGTVADFMRMRHR